MQTIALEVSDPRTGVVARRVYPLPVTIGRGSSCTIQLAADNRAISRIHLEIVEERGQPIVYNRASNLEASGFRGRPLVPNERVELAAGDRLSIFDTSIAVLPPPALGILIVRRADLKVTASEALLPGAAILCTEADGALLVTPVADVARIDPAMLGSGLAVMFYYDAAEPTFAILANPAALPVELDRERVDQAALYLRAQDTIEIGDHRFEVLGTGTPGIVCENPDCRVLNACDDGETCRRCGAPLFGSTRLLRVRKL